MSKQQNKKSYPDNTASNTSHSINTYILQDVLRGNNIFYHTKQHNIDKITIPHDSTLLITGSLYQTITPYVNQDPNNATLSLQFNEIAKLVLNSHTVMSQPVLPGSNPMHFGNGSPLILGITPEKVNKTKDFFKDTPTDLKLEVKVDRSYTNPQETIKQLAVTTPSIQQGFIIQDTKKKDAIKAIIIHTKPTHEDCCNYKNNDDNNIIHMNSEDIPLNLKIIGVHNGLLAFLEFADL